MVDDAHEGRDARADVSSLETPARHSLSPWRLRIILLTMFCAVATLGVFLYQSRERERQLRNDLWSVLAERDQFEQDVSRLENRLNNVQRQLALSEESLAEVREMLNDAEKALVKSQSKFDDCVTAARRLRSRLDNVASEINSGTRFLTSIPSESVLSFSRLSFYEDDLAGEYKKILGKYNDLVDRFNAAVQRCNELQDTVNAVIRVLGG